MSYTPRRVCSPEQIRTKYNNSAVALGAYLCVIQDTGDDFVKLPTAVTDAVVGITMMIIPAYGWGDVQIAGKAIGTAVGALATRGVGLTTNSAGTLAAKASSGGTLESYVGTLNTTAGTALDLVEVELAGPLCPLLLHS